MSAPTGFRKLSEVYGQEGEGHAPHEQKQKELALQYLPLVKNELSRLKMRIPSFVEADDLYGVALTAMMRSLRKWTPDTDKTFGVYLRKRIRGSLLDELRRLDVFSRSARKKAREYDAVVARLEQRLARAATEGEIRREMGLSKQEFVDLMEELRPVTFLSVDAPIGDEESGANLSEILDDPVETNAREVAERKDQVEAIKTRIRVMPKDQQRVLHLYYFEELRLAEIASVFNVSESRISQLHTQAIRSLKISMNQTN